MVLDRCRRGVLPFLLLAYPFTFLVFQGGRYCGPLCFEPTALGGARVAALLLAAALVAGAATVVVRFTGLGAANASVSRFLVPSPLASAVLLAVFGSFVVFLALDSLALYEGVWKPLVLPLSFLLFLPVWVLYAASFLLAVLFSVLGVEPSPLLTLAFRAVVVAVGFPLSAAFQTALVTAVVGGRRPRPGQRRRET